MSVKQISVFLENAPGSLMAFCRVLREHQIDMRALNVAETTEYGVMRLITDDLATTMKVLAEEDYIAKTTDVLVMELDDTPGALVAMLSVLSDAKININYFYAALLRAEGKAYLVAKVSDVQAAEKVLADAGYHPLSEEEFAGLLK